ncbi:MAG: threonylcarbamoyl-AMP synthase [Ruminococcaceae bacterium]|nr:threonylcarbamoyl-AMP synthase [Oscillospiraceae bacterium]
MLQTEYIKITEDEAGDAALRRAASHLRAGELVVFPTETVYGLGGDGTNAEAAKRIYAAKGRPSDNPLIIHIASPEDAEKYAYTNKTYEKLAKAFMPGPLTVILPRREIIPPSTTGGLDSVAIRCPAHPVARRLIELCGIPIAAPSANLSGKPSPTCAEHVREDLDGRVSMILDGGESEIGLESTIVKIDGERLTLLRPGAVTYDALCMVCEHVTIADAVTHRLAENERPLSPGMKYRHYAPSAPLVLLAGERDHQLAFLKAAQKKEKCAILCYEEEMPYLDGERLLCVGSANDLPTQAHKLFHALRDADTTDADIIYAHLPPMEGLGLALYNRMIRAAAHTVLQL